MPTIKVQVSGKVAKNLTPEIEIVCNNEDYEIEYDFDEAWSGALAKTGLFICNGKLIPVPFDGNVCPVPIIENAKLLAVGVSTSDGKLATTTPAYVNCLLSASDLAKNKIPPPSKSVYDEIIALLNKYLQQGGGEGGGAKEIVIADVVSIVDEQKVEEFLELSRRASLGEILIMGKLTINSGANYGIIQGIHYDDSGERAVANWSLVSSVWYGIAEDMSLQNVKIEVYGLECDGETITLGMGSPSMGDTVTAKEQLINPSETWTPDEQAAACETIGAVRTENGELGKTFAYVVNGEGKQDLVRVMNAREGNAIAQYNAGGQLGVSYPTDIDHAVSKNYLELFPDFFYNDQYVNADRRATIKSKWEAWLQDILEIGDIETALDSIIAIQNTLIGGGTV